MSGVVHIADILDEKDLEEIPALDFLKPVKIPEKKNATTVIESRTPVSNEIGVAKMFAAGMSINDISACIGMTYDEVSHFVSSPNGQTMIKDCIDVEDDRAIKNLLAAARLDSILSLIRLRDHGETGQIKVAASRELNVMLEKLGDIKKRPNVSPEKAQELAKEKLKKMGLI